MLQVTDDLIRTVVRDVLAHMKPGAAPTNGKAGGCWGVFDDVSEAVAAASVIITPVTHSLPTLAGNAINILAAGNALVCNPHPSGAGIAVKGTQLFNQAIAKAIGLDNLLTIIGKPTLESAQAIFDHRDVRLLCVTGGPA